MAKLPWKPWHEVVTLREDLRKGELTLSMFAADLYDVLMQRGKRPVYEKAENFFALTYPTYNLRRLVREVVLRLAGKNDKAVRQLELTYGGGKTHTLITLRHLVFDPDKLPDLPAVSEFITDIGQKPPKSLVVGLCFDKLDVEKGTHVTDPNGKVRALIQPWSVLAYQIAGDDGLKLLHSEGKAEERNTAPAENLLIELLERPTKQGLGILVLIDEVLMYAREKIGNDEVRVNSLVNFFQGLTQAATKVDRCCVVASLLTSEPTNQDKLGRQIQGQLYDIFQRQREEAIEPVVKEDVAEVLRRRFFTPQSIKDPSVFRQHVVAALKGIAEVDEQTAKQGAEAEERFLKSYPFHPDLTEVLYGKWTQLDRFQRTRGVLRTFALALREAENWDTSPLVGPSVFLSKPTDETVSEALRELVTVADTEEWEGRRQNWTGILVGELARARQIQTDSVGLKYREIEQAVIATFLHSQPIGQTAKTRDLLVLLGSTRPFKIELEKGMTNWAQKSYWLDDIYTGVAENQLPTTWRLGNRPNLTQMHAVAQKNFNDETVKARLLDEISKVKSLSNSASALGVKVHTLPTRPKDIEDDGAFHYSILGPSAASDSGKPNPEAKKFIDETTGSDKPRVFRNSVLLLVPSKDGLEVAMARVREYLAWEQVLDEIKKQQKDGNVDPARAQTLRMNIDTSKGRMPDAIRQAYCIVVTVSEKDDVHAFKITVTDEQHFNIIKSDKRSRVQDTAITAEALLPDGPYNLWKKGETSRRVKDLAGAFAQLPHLPKMLKASAILDTLVKGCEDGTFVLRLVRPDRTSRTWWMARPDEAALNDPAMELVLPEAGEIVDVNPDLLAPRRLPGLWTSDEITVKDLFKYFDGTTAVTVDRGNYQEPLRIPKASQPSLEKGITAAVESGYLWLLSGPASILGEWIPAGVLNPESRLCAPPPPVAAAEILPENLPDAWKEGNCSGLSVATSLSMKAGKTLPWKTVKDVISGALQARFIEIAEDPGTWPCDFPNAQFAKFKVTSVIYGSGAGAGGVGSGGAKVLVASADLEPSQLQELGDVVPELLKIKARTNTPIRFHVRIDVGDGKTLPSANMAQEVNTVLKNVKDDFEIHQ
jgi:hypothetical protein